MAIQIVKKRIMRRIMMKPPKKMYMICGGKEKLMRINKTQISKYRGFFYVFIVIFFVYCLCLLPEYLLDKSWEYPNDKVWNPINDFVRDNAVLNYFRSIVFNKIPESTIPPAIILNAGNMIFGFINYKKKWWYYLILIVSILCSVILYDHYIMFFYSDVAA